MILNNTRNSCSSGIELHSFDSVDKLAISEIYLSWLNDLEVVKPIASPILLSPKDLSFIDESFRRFTSSNAIGFFIKDLNDHKFVGTAKIDKIDTHNRSAEIGIMIGDKSKWNRGISVKVYKILLHHAFEVMKLNRVWGGTNGLNIAMKKTFLKLRFREEGILKKASLIDGEYSDNYLYAILADEYFSKKED